MKKTIKLMLIVAAVLQIAALNISAQQVSNVTNSWFGNSNANDQIHMPQGIEDVFVTGDGAVYSNVQWEEGGGQLTCVKDGVVSHGWGNHGRGRLGGNAITANSKFVYYSQTISYDGGFSASTSSFPQKDHCWFGISRRNRSGLSGGVPFEGGKGGQYETPSGCFLPIFDFTMGYLDTLEINKIVRYGITGLYSNNEELFVATDFDSTIRVLDAQTMALKRSWKLDAAPFRLFMDNQDMLWVSLGENATKVERYNANGIKQDQEITLPLGSFLGDFCIDKNNRMLISDIGQNEQVLIYTNIDIDPSQTSTFGNKYGIYSGVPGQMAPLKFHQVRGLGTDTLGNIYIGNTQWYTEGMGYILESYTETGSLNWTRNCVLFGDNIGLDAATDGRDGYGSAEHFTFDYTLPAGTEGKQTGYTVNRYKYPHDQRLIEAGSSGKAYVRYYNGIKFLITMDGDVGLPLCIYRFNYQTDGEVAIPCVKWSADADSITKSPDGNWMWRDLNANGQMEANEYIITQMASSGGGYSAFIDADMSLWVANGAINTSPCVGVDPNGVPMYNPEFTTFSPPQPFTDIHRLKYYPESDIMYIGGITIDYPEVTHWKTMGRVLCRYNDWSKGNRTYLYKTIVPFDPNEEGCETISFDVAGDYFFTSISRGGKDIEFGQINIFEAATGKSVGYIRPPWDEIGWSDMTECVSAIKRSNGEYVITNEEDGRNKQVMYRWCPSGNCLQTITPVSAVSINNKPSIVAVGEKIYLTASVSPANASVTAVYWTSSNPAIVSVTASGILHGLSEGQATITATSFDGNKTASFELSVNFIHLTKIEITSNVDSVSMFDFNQLSIKPYPDNASNQKVTWSSSDTTIAKVDETGLVKGILEGVASIKVIAEDGGLTDTFNIKVTPMEKNKWIVVDDLDAGWNWSGFYLDICGTCYKNSSHSTLTVNDYAEYTFTGTDIELYCETWYDAGSVEIFIDGVSKGVFTQVVEPYGGAMKFAAFSGLSSSKHIIKIVSTTASWIGIDFIRYGINPPISAITGIITGDFAFSYSEVDLSKGSSDWKHFANNDHKAIGSKINTISDYSSIGGNVVKYFDDKRVMKWIVGTPLASSSGNSLGISISGIDKGFSFTVPASEKIDTINVYVSGNGGGGTLTVSCNDNSTKEFSKSVALTRSGIWDGTFSIMFDAKGDLEKLLTFTWKQATVNGEIRLQAASIAGEEIYNSLITMANMNQQTTIYPNPFAGGVLTMKFSEPCKNEIIISDITGKIVYKTQSENSILRIPNLTLCPGLYFVSINNNSMQDNIKLIVK